LRRGCWHKARQSVAPGNIAQRVSYAETGATGQGVTETTDGKAGAEIAAVWNYVRGLLDG
jgi:chromosome partitioning protein